MEEYLAQLETIICHAAAGSQEANQRLDVERSRSDCWTEACYELLQRRGWGTAAAQHDSITFYALTALQRSQLFRSDDPSNKKLSTLRAQLRTLILTTILHRQVLQSMPNFVATKVAVILALVLREDYPTAWPCPFKDLSSSLSVDRLSANEDNSGILMYLRFLDAISDEIVYPSAGYQNDQSENFSASVTQYISTRREIVKDVLRGFTINHGNERNGPVQSSIPLEQTDAAQIMKFLFDTISMNAAGGTYTFMNKHDAKLEIASRAAMTLRRYLSWVDIQLSTSSGLVNCLLFCLGLAAPGNKNTSGINGVVQDDDDDTKPGTSLAEESAHCLQEIVTRGMEEKKKECLLIELDVIGTIYRLVGLNNAGPARLDIMNPGATQIDAVIAIASLINAMGQEVLTCWEFEHTQSASLSSPVIMSIIGQSLELSLACLMYDDIDVSGAVVTLTSRVLLSTEKHEAAWNVIQGSNGEKFTDKLIQRILSILHERMKYPPTFEFDYEDDIEAEEEMYRTQLRKLYQRIVKFKNQIALDYILQCFSSLSEHFATASTGDIEVALRLLHHYGEGRRPSPGAKTALKDSAFREVLMALHRSDVSSHPHREVLILYYDLSVRYAAILKEMPDLLSNLLTGLSGAQGLQHIHPRVRSRCCYLLLRLTKAAGGMAMRPYVEVVVDGIQGLLFPSEDNAVLPIQPNDSLYLFETTGLLLGTTGLDEEMQQRCATGVLKPHVHSMEQILQSPDLQRDPDVYAEQLSMSISAIAQLSKGWQGHPPLGVQNVLSAAVDICLKVLLTLPASSSIRNRTSVLLQRMILSLGESILPKIPEFLHGLLSNCTLEDDIMDISQLINQLCIKFKEKAVHAVDSSLLLFLQKVLALSESPVLPDGNGVSNPPHVLTEQLSIRKQAFSSLQHIATHNVSAVFYSEKNVGSIEDILCLMSSGATMVPEPVIKKTCTVFFGELTRAWGQECDTAPINVKNGYFDFIYREFLPAMLRCILDASFNAKDAMQYRVLTEFGVVLSLLKQSYRGGAEFNTRMAELIRNGSINLTGQPSTASPDTIVTGFQNASSEKDMDMCLRAWKSGEVQ